MGPGRGCWYSSGGHVIGGEAGRELRLLTLHVTCDPLATQNSGGALFLRGTNPVTINVYSPTRFKNNKAVGVFGGGRRGKALCDGLEGDGGVSDG